LLETFRDRTKRALKVLLGRSDCVKLIQFQGTTYEFTPIEGVIAGASISVGKLKTAPVELVAVTRSAVQLDNTQFLLCRDKDQYPEKSPVRQWINEKRMAAMGTILYFASALETFAVDETQGREDLREAMGMIKDLARSMGKGPPSSAPEARRPPSTPKAPVQPAPVRRAPADEGPSEFHDFLTRDTGIRRSSSRPARKAGLPRPFKGLVLPERLAVRSTLEKLGIDPRDFPD
jgi:hypothetical protein